MTLHPMFGLVVRSLPCDMPADAVFAAVLLVCSETGLGLAVSLQQARAAARMYRARQAAREDGRPASSGHSGNVSIVDAEGETMKEQ